MADDIRQAIVAEITAQGTDLMGAVASEIDRLRDAIVALNAEYDAGITTDNEYVEAMRRQAAQLASMTKYFDELVRSTQEYRLAQADLSNSTKQASQDERDHAEAVKLLGDVLRADYTQAEKDAAQAKKESSQATRDLQEAERLYQDVMKAEAAWVAATGRGIAREAAEAKRKVAQATREGAQEARDAAQAVTQAERDQAHEVREASAAFAAYSRGLKDAEQKEFEEGRAAAYVAQQQRELTRAVEAATRSEVALVGAVDLLAQAEGKRAVITGNATKAIGGSVDRTYDFTQTTKKAGGALDDASIRTAAWTRTVYFAAQGVEDLQYSFAAVVNNIPLVANSMAQALGKSQTAAMQWAAGLSLAAVAVNSVLIPAVQNFVHGRREIEEWFHQMNVSMNPFYVEKYSGEIDKLTERLKVLHGRQVKIGVDFAEIEMAERRLKDLQEAKAAFEESGKTRTHKEDATGKAIAEALKDAGEVGVRDTLKGQAYRDKIVDPATQKVLRATKDAQEAYESAVALYGGYSPQAFIKGDQLQRRVRESDALIDKIRKDSETTAGGLILGGKKGTDQGLKNLQDALRASGQGDLASRVGAEAYGARTPKEVKQGDEAMESALKRRQQDLDNKAFAANKALVDAGGESDKAKAEETRRATEANRERSSEIDRMAAEAAKPKGLLEAKRAEILDRIGRGQDERQIMDEVGPGVADTMRALPGNDPTLANAASALAVRNMIARLRPDMAAIMPMVGNDPRRAAGMLLQENADAINEHQGRADRRGEAAARRESKAAREQSIGATAGNLQQALGANPIEAETISRRAHDLRDKGVSDPRALRQATTEMQQRTIGAMAKTQENQMMLANLFGDITIQIDALDQRNKLIDANLQRAQRANMNTRRNAGQGRGGR